MPYTFFLSSAALLPLKGNVPMFCVCAPINHSLPLSLLPFILPYKAVSLVSFLSFILSAWLHSYFYGASILYHIFCSVFLLK